MFGLVSAVLMFSVLLILPHPLGARIFFSAEALYLLWGAWLVWSRTRLALATGALIISAAGLSAFAFAGVSPVHPESVRAAPLVGIFIAGAVAGALMLVESRRHPAEWAAWRRQTEQSTFWEMLRGGHIPNLKSKL